MWSPIENPGPVRIDRLAPHALFPSGVSYSVLRLDTMAGPAAGNKVYKLQEYLATALYTQKTRLISFGGVWSNHLVALAAAAKALGLRSMGIVRGEAPDRLSEALEDARGNGMDLRFVTRSAYRAMQSAASLAAIENENPDAAVIPEGGSGEPGRRGAARIAEIPGMEHFSHLCVPVGTGTTVSGLATRCGPSQEIVGVSVLKGTNGLAPLPGHWQTPGAGSERIKMWHEYHAGGYGAFTPMLLQFMNAFYDAYGIPSDFVYTGKMFYAVSLQAQKGFFPKGSNVVMIHTGGLQGNRSLHAGSLHFNDRG